MAGGPGFEPELPGPEPGVLPLNYPPRKVLKYHTSLSLQRGLQPKQCCDYLSIS